jgi:hypothetical protein
MHGHIVVDPTGFDWDQKLELSECVKKYSGWQHPDGVRWVLTVESPNAVKDKLIRGGWPATGINIPI